MSRVYLLCFAAGGGLETRPGVRATHYIGWTAGTVDERLETHIAGRGSPLIRAVIAAGQTVTVARVWDPADRTFERRLKNRREAPRLCPLCVAAGRTGTRGLIAVEPG